MAVSVHTTNRPMSGVGARGGACRRGREAGYAEADLVRMGLDAADQSFLGEDARQAARLALRAWAHGRALPGF